MHNIPSVGGDRPGHQGVPHGYGPAAYPAVQLPKAPSGPTTIVGTAGVFALIFAALSFVPIFTVAGDDEMELIADRAILLVLGALLIGAVVGLIVGWIAFGIRKASYQRRYNAYAAYMQSMQAGYPPRY